ncbi:hypothetical protein P2G88_01140 [Aliiglaciecola sp. CAU 1673]|uniref:hypothetical protein n=1 Tax=Aliiglaciecola sp. CAU 1673 TaxID=3032595 RepID=UPI0023DB30A9|nr:hypothetical protein [Aliiglaciecola sp. CAU 1673]MDF2176855.1 hypothetical protein [Aliiglaciecola sp. CAU 1673]
MYKRITGAFALLGMITPGFAAGHIDYLNVFGNTVIFSTNASKNTTSPSCVAVEHQDNWAVSLQSENGRAVYSLLITAMAGKLPIDVISAQDCADSDGIERPSSVVLTQLNIPSSSVVKNIQLYKNDGETLVGRVIDFNDKNFTLVYLPPGENYNVSFYKPPAVSPTLYYLQPDCLGTPYTFGGMQVFYTPGFNDSRYFRTEGSNQLNTFHSSRTSPDICENITPKDQYLFKVDFSYYEDNTCGAAPCVIKEE